MIVIELLILALCIVFTLFVITQLVIPIALNHEIFWLFRKKSPKRRLQKLYVQLNNAKDEKEIRSIKAEIKKINQEK